MKIIVVADESLLEELLAQGLNDEVELVVQQEPLPVTGADACIDLLFDSSVERMEQLKKFQPASVIVHALNETTTTLPPGFIRINAWNSFLKRSVVEAAGTEAKRTATEKIFSCFNKTTEWVADVPGFITARVVGMIINEAWFTLEEDVSTKAAIDTAMKLGTNYPYGPFEWGDKIGLKNVYELLVVLAKTNSRYQPSALLQKAALLS